MNSSPTSTFQLTLEAVQQLARSSEHDYGQSEILEAVSKILVSQGHKFNTNTVKRCLVAMTPGSYKNVDYHAQLQGLMSPSQAGAKRWKLNAAAIDQLVADREAGRRYMPKKAKAGPKPKSVLSGTPIHKIVQVLYDQVFKDMGVRVDYIDTWVNLTYSRLSQKTDAISRQDVKNLLSQATAKKLESPVAGLFNARTGSKWELNAKRAKVLLS